MEPTGRRSRVRAMANGYPVPVAARSHWRRTKASAASSEYGEGIVVISGM